MYDRCRVCGKSIESADDCRLVMGSDDKINAYCLSCYTKLREKRV